MRPPPAATRRPRQHLWWRWRLPMMTGGSGSKKRARRTRKPDPTALLTDDLLVEILARVPYRSLCRCRCVSKRWRALISHPDHRARLPQTLAGIFYHGPVAVGCGGSPESTSTSNCFASVPGTAPPLIHTSFSFLPDREREELVLVDSCNGLILFRCYRFPDEGEFDYLVLNPATEKWVAVPITRRWSSKVQTVHLGFDPAVSSHFHVFEFQVDIDDDDYDAGDGHVLGVKIYLSATGVWSHRQSGWSMEISFELDLKSVFLDGMLYVIARESVVGSVDVEGKTWRIINFPRSKDSRFYDTGGGFIDLSQGRLHLANDDDMVGDKLAIWVLEDKDNEQWTLKHTVRYKHLVRRKHVHFGFHEFIVVAIHPDRNMVFFVFGLEKTLISYNMDSGKVSIIRNLGRTCNEHFLPYVPLFSNSLPDGGNREPAI
ncbi:hypothetical protein SEVIR_3G373600v4 [Setaria viridis]|uniref:F-box domain-containing protein n=2 Tax=Setaria viridis TaxID=4556 RepID=A0A4U6VN27_SETVI|nr:F-box protein At5g07610-like [Setaria viridis]TKW29099.1 hypothetical protein SEVIR_3G373600v2 [Setaria viridis]